MPVLSSLWAALAATPLLGLGATLVAWRLALGVQNALRGSGLANPTLIAVFILVLALAASGLSYEAYLRSAQYVHFLLGPATVALAVPMHTNLARIRRSARAVVPALLAGSFTAAISAMVLARLLGAPRVVVLTIAPKSVTTPIAMGIAEKIGGQASLAAIIVILTGLVGAVMLSPVMRLAGVTDRRAQGLAAGTAGHGIATARALQLSETAGAFGGLAIGLNGIVTAILLPLIAHLLAG